MYVRKIHQTPFQQMHLILSFPDAHLAECRPLVTTRANSSRANRLTVFLLPRFLCLQRRASQASGEQTWTRQASS